MMVNSAKPGEGEGLHALPLSLQYIYSISTITSTVMVCAPAERADTLPLIMDI
jgi:hypothetical protein